MLFSKERIKGRNVYTTRPFFIETNETILTFMATDAHQHDHGLPSKFFKIFWVYLCLSSCSSYGNSPLPLLFYIRKKAPLLGLALLCLWLLGSFKLQRCAMESKSNIFFPVGGHVLSWEPPKQAFLYCFWSLPCSLSGSKLALWLTKSVY